MVMITTLRVENIPPSDDIVWRVNNIKAKQEEGKIRQMRNWK